MNGATFVAGVLMFCITFVGIYDVIALAAWGQAYTVSYVIKGWSSQFPMIPLIIGLVLGHILWPVGLLSSNDGKEKPPPAVKLAGEPEPANHGMFSTVRPDWPGLEKDDPTVLP